MTHFRHLEKLLRLRGRTREEAEDVIQETFLRVKVYLDAGGEIRQPEAFLVRTALNLSSDVHDREHRHLYVQQSLEDLLLVDGGPSAEEVLAADQTLERLKRTLDASSRRTREVFFLHRLYGMSYVQIADHFDISVSAVEKHIAKAMSVLGRAMPQP